MRNPSPENRSVVKCISYNYTFGLRGPRLGPAGRHLPWPEAWLSGGSSPALQPLLPAATSPGRSGVYQQAPGVVTVAQLTPLKRTRIKIEYDTPRNADTTETDVFSRSFMLAKIKIVRNVVCFFTQPSSMHSKKLEQGESKIVTSFLANMKPTEDEVLLNPSVYLEMTVREDWPLHMTNPLLI